MDKELLQQYLLNDSSLDLNDLDIITAISDKYPYFQIPRILFLKNQRRLRRPDFFENLKKNVIYISNKNSLYNHINSIEYLTQNENSDNTELKTGNKAEVEKSNKKSSADGNLKPKKTKDKKVDNDPETNNAVNIITEAFNDDLFELDADLKEKQKENKKQVKKEINKPNNENQHNLIDAFIKAQPRITPKEDIGNEIVDISGKSVIENEDFMTETLAKVYIKQGYYSKAMFIYEKLSLKYPEKNTYFAAQIEKIKKLSNKL